ncbi:MAG: ATP-binding cassette domain-containing protein [Deltaproteobacteria bacterium]|nr:MAG: ATP-binding cassette domain-containing protein [Deltaproteobacteria bacterium]
MTAETEVASSTSPKPKPKRQGLSGRFFGRYGNKMFGLARPETRTLAWGTLFLLVGSGMGLLYPQGIRIVMDSALKQGSTKIIDYASIAMAVVFLIQGVAIAARSYLFTVAGERIVAKLRQQLYGNVISQEIGFFDQTRTGELLNRLSSDTTVLQNTVSVNISMGLRNLASAVGGIGLLLYTSPKLTLLMLSIVPPVALGAVFFGRKIRTLSRQAQDALANASEVAEETISGIRTVRAFNREDREQDRYNEAVDRSFDVARQRALAGGLFGGVVSFAAYFAIAVVLWYGGHLVIAKKMSTGELTSFLLYTLIVAVSLAALSSLYADFMRATGAAERVFDLLERTSEIPTGEGETPKSIEGKIELRQVGFHYPTRPDVTVLDELDLLMHPGEIVAIVGPSGSGKSTIASLVPRFYDANQGQVLLDGEPIESYDPGWLRQQIGIVAQEPILFSTTIADNIRYGRLTATQEELEAAAKAANAHDFISSFPEGYETTVGERGVQLSGGQKQRIAIARAVLKDPRILILDEATSALDAESESLVKDALDRLMEGRTTLVIAHRLSTVKDADRVVVLDQGRIAQSGTHDELLHVDGIYRRLVEKQFVAAS